MEFVKVFDGDFRYIEDATRDHVHVTGKWHETFHCWFVDEQFVYVQKRSATKSDFPSMFDITAAGHLEANETVKDGVREIEEELGIAVSYDELLPLGLVKDIIVMPNFHDYEFAHIYLYKGTFQAGDFSLQEDEVEGIYTIAIPDFVKLCFQTVDEVVGNRLDSNDLVTIQLQDFVPHEKSYFQAIGKALSLAK